MTEKRFTYLNTTGWNKDGFLNVMNGLNEKNKKLQEENEQLKKDVEYWKQVAIQYSNELNVFEHCKKYKTECKDIHWSSDWMTERDKVTVEDIIGLVKSEPTNSVELKKELYK